MKNSVIEILQITSILLVCSLTSCSSAEKPTKTITLPDTKALIIQQGYLGLADMSNFDQGFSIELRSYSPGKKSIDWPDSRYKFTKPVTFCTNKLPQELLQTFSFTEITRNQEINGPAIDNYRINIGNSLRGCYLRMDNRSLNYLSYNKINLYIVDEPTTTCRIEYFVNESPKQDSHSIDQCKSELNVSMTSLKIWTDKKYVLFSDPQALYWGSLSNWEEIFFPDTKYQLYLLIENPYYVQ